MGSKWKYGRKHDCKDQFTYIRWYYINEIVIITRSFYGRIYIVSMGMNTSSRLTPTSSMYNLPFTSRLRRSCSVEILSGEVPEEYDSWKLSGSHDCRESIGSTHRGILETYTTNFGVNNISSKVEHCSKADETIYQRHYISGKEFPKWLNRKDVVG